MEEERLRTYLKSLEPEPDALILEMEKYAAENFVPIAKRETAAFLVTLTMAQRPMRVLEIGTAIGYSALRLISAMPEGGRIVTIERNEKRLASARDYIRRAGREEDIEILAGDAAKILPTLSGSFDMAFMDAAKGQYPVFLPEVLRLLKKGGVLITDNILQEGTLLDTRYAVTRRDRTIHTRMRDYIYKLKTSEGLATSLIPLGDGVALTIKDW